MIGSRFFRSRISDSLFRPRQSIGCMLVPTQMDSHQPEPHSIDVPSLDGLRMAGLAVSVGIIAGFGAVFFRALISLFHNLFFLGKLSLTYDANQHTPPFWIEGWGWLVILAPV